MAVIKKIRTVALNSVKEAGQFLIKHQLKVKILKNKKAEFLTSADDKSENIIIKNIKKHFPRDNIFSEDSGLFNQESIYQWIIDPLDDTNQYLKNIPFYAINLCLQKNNKNIYSICLIPSTNSLFEAFNNKSFLNNKQITVSKCKDIKKVIIYIEPPVIKHKRLPITKSQFNHQWKIFNKIASSCLRFRCIGSGAIGLAYTAMGAFDAYIKLTPGCIEDTYPGIYLLESSRGIVTTEKKEKYDLTKNSLSMLVAANKNLHKNIINYILN